MPKYPENPRVTLSGNSTSAGAGFQLIQNGTMTLAGGNNITLSQNGNAVTISAASIQADTQTAISGIAASNTTYTSGTVTITGVGGGVTVSSNTGQRVDISVAAQSTQTQGILSAGVSTGGNTAGNTTVNTGSRFVLVASGNATASQATAAGASTITLSVGTQTVQTQGILSAGVSTGGNTAGNTQVSTGSRLVIVGSNGITASQGTAAGATTITLSGITQTQQTQGILSAGVSTGGNTSGNTTVNTGSRFVLAGGNNITLSQETAAGATTITISGAAAGGGATVSMWPNQAQTLTQVAMTNAYFVTNATTAQTTGTAIIMPMALEANVSFNQVRIPMGYSITTTVTTVNWSHTFGNSLGIYTLTGDTLSLLSSFSHEWRLSYASTNNATNASASWTASYGSGTGFSTSTSLSTNNAGVTGFWSSISALKMYPFATGGMSMAPGQYWAAWAFSSKSVGSNVASFSQIVINTAVQSMVISYPEIGKSVASSTGLFPLLGQFSFTQTNTAMPASVLTADLTTASNATSLVGRSVYIQLQSRF